jgi:hypothetical protein
MFLTTNVEVIPTAKFAHTPCEKTDTGRSIWVIVEKVSYATPRPYSNGSYRTRADRDGLSGYSWFDSIPLQLDMGRESIPPHQSCPRS